MLRLYKDGKSKEVHPVDARGWIKNGWTTLPTAVAPGASKPPTEPPENPPAQGKKNTTAKVKKVNINTDAAKTIADHLKGVGDAKAKTIIENRPYKNLDGLEQLLPEVNWVELGNQVEF